MIQLIRLARRRFRDRARDDRARQRRLRWALLLVGGLTVGLYVVGSNAAAGASPRQRADLAAPAQPTGCEWAIVALPDGSKIINLWCDGDNHARAHHELERDLWPPIPDGCREVTENDLPKVVCEDTVEPSDTTMEWVRCRDEHDFMFDDEKDVRIPRDAPQWWKDEIRIETEADEGRGCSLAERPPQPLCRQVDVETYDAPGMLPDQCWGTYPSSNYTLSWDDGGPFDFKNKMQGWTGSFMYTIGKGAIVVVLWLVGWAFSFDITQYTTFATNIASSYDTSIVGPFGLHDIVWFVLVAWCGFAALRGKIGMAGGELLITIVVVGIMTVLLADQGRYMDRVGALMDDTSARLLVAGQAERCLERDVAPPEVRGNPQGDCRDGEVLVESDPERSARLIDEIRPLQQHIHEAFVEQPYAYLNWGRVLTDDCLGAQNHIVGTGYDDGGWPQRHMERAGCEDAASFSRDVTGERMLGAFLTMLVALVVAFFLGLMALTVVISKFLVALLFAVLPFAAVGAVLPGTGRRMAWSWFGTLLQLVAAVVLMSFLLSLLLLGVDEVLRTTSDIELVQRWFIVLLIVGAVYFGRKRMLASSKSLGESFADSMTRLSPGGRNWSGGSKGIDLAGIDRGAKNTMWAGGVAAVATGRVLGSRLRERRVARRGYRNLEKMERTRERPRLEYRMDGYRFHPSPSTPTPMGRATPAPSSGGPAPSSGGPTPSRPTPSPGGGGRPSGGSSPKLSPAQTRGAVDLGSRAPTPAPPERAPTPVTLARERLEMVHMRRAPQTFLRHPIGHIKDRFRAQTPLVGTNAQAQRYAQRAYNRVNNPRPRGKGLGWR